MHAVEDVARTTASVLDEDYDLLSEERQKRFRLVAYRGFEASMAAYLSGIDEAHAELQAVMASNTVKARFTGLRHALDVLEELRELEADVVNDETPSSVPEGIMELVDSECEDDDDL